MRSQSGTVPGPWQPEQFEHGPNTQADHDRRHNKTGHGEVEYGATTTERGPKRQSGQERQDHGHDHDHETEGTGAAKGAPDVTNRLRSEKVDKPMYGHTLHRERQAPLRPLEGQQYYGCNRSIEKQHEEAKEASQHVKTPWSSVTPHGHHSSFWTSTTRSNTTIMPQTAMRSTRALAAAGGNCR